VFSNLSITVAICSADRSDELELALESLKLQSFDEFEIICVLGPGSEVSDRHKESFKNLTIIKTKERNLSFSRNLALRNCSTEIIAYLDDDARAEVSWVEQIRSPFLDPTVGVVGGWTRGRGGESWQVLNVATDILGRSTFSMNQIHSDLVGQNHIFRTPRPQGANSAFRVKPLAEAGGFDDYLVWNFDEVEATFRVLELGYIYKNNPLAVVHHYLAASKMRDTNGIPLDNYYIWRSRSYFTMRRAAGIVAQTNIMRVIFDEFNQHKKWLISVFFAGQISFDHCNYLCERGQLGIEEGFKKGFDEALLQSAQTIRQTEPAKNLTKKKNIILVTPEWFGETTGGIGLWYENLAKEFVNQGHLVHLIGLGDTERVFKDGFWQIRVNGGWHYVPGNDFIQLDGARSARQASLREEINRINQGSKVDCVMVSNWGSLGIGLNGPWKLIISIHTSKNLINKISVKEGFKLDLMDDLEARLEVEALRKADLIISSSDGTIDHYRTPDFILPEIIKIPLGINYSNVGQSQFSRDTLQCAHEHFIFIGRNEPRKNPQLAIEIVSKLFTQHTQEVGLILIGDGTDIFNQRQNSGSPCIHGLGKVSEAEKFELVSKSLGLLVTSRYESFGLTALEAMSLGKIVISNNVGGLSETVEEGYSGFLFEEGDVESAVKFCWLIFSDLGLKQQMEENAKKRFREFFTIQQNVAVLLQRAI
jgi:glycosyltransferase involved in cell wall biosynthesis/GT2 family glycosyltransferase